MQQFYRVAVAVVAAVAAVASWWQSSSPPSGCRRTTLRVWYFVDQGYWPIGSPGQFFLQLSLPSSHFLPSPPPLLLLLSLSLSRINQLVFLSEEDQEVAAMFAEKQIYLDTRLLVRKDFFDVRTASVKVAQTFGWSSKVQTFKPEINPVWEARISKCSFLVWSLIPLRHLISLSHKIFKTMPSDDCCSFLIWSFYVMKAALPSADAYAVKLQGPLCSQKSDYSSRFSNAAWFRTRFWAPEQPSWQHQPDHFLEFSHLLERGSRGRDGGARYRIFVPAAFAYHLSRRNALPDSLLPFPPSFWVLHSSWPQRAFANCISWLPHFSLLKEFMLSCL